MSDQEEEDIDLECADCYAGLTLDPGCEPTDPPLCHECEKERLRKEITRLEAQVVSERKDHIHKLIELTAECFVDDATYLAGPIEARESERIRHNLVEENNDLGLYVHRLESGMCRNGTEGCKDKGTHDCQEVVRPTDVTAQLFKMTPVPWNSTAAGVKPGVDIVLKINIPFPFNEDHVRAAQHYAGVLLNSKNIRNYYEVCPVCKSPALKLWDNEKGCEHCTEEED